MNSKYEPFNVYLADVSYFSGKLEALLRYKQINFKRINSSVGILVNEVYPNTGVMKVPAVKLANAQWLKDTTPMFDWLEMEYPQYPIMPEDPVLHFLSKLIEDYADEWCWRSAMYWRWCFTESRNLLAPRISKEVLADWPIPSKLGAWYFANRQITTFLLKDGLTKKTEPYIKQHYLDLLSAMETILETQKFLLGTHPSLVDFALFGPMFRHFALDPAPAKVMRDEAPRVNEWVARMWNAKGGQLPKTIQYSDFDTTGWQYFLKDIVQTYWPMLCQNAKSWKAGKNCMDFETSAVTYPKLKVVHYRVYCLEVLQDLYRNLSAKNQEQVDKILSPYGRIAMVDNLDSGLKNEFNLPLAPSYKVPSVWQKFKLTITGTPWDKPSFNVK